MKLVKLSCVVLLVACIGCGPKGKVYMIRLSPTGMDAVINLANTSNNYGTEKELNIFCDSINGKRYTNRALFCFDLKKLPMARKVDSVFLQLYFNENSGLYKVKDSGHSGNTGLIVERIETNWDEHTINWQTYPKVWSKGLEFPDLATRNQDFRLNVTSLFNAKQQTGSIALLVRLLEEEPGNYVHLHSKEGMPGNAAQLKIYLKK